MARTPSAIGPSVRAVLAVANKNRRVMGRYPIVAVGLALIPLYQLVLPALLLGVTFLVGGRSLGLERSAGTQDLVGFLFLGGFMCSVIYGMFWGTAWDLRREMESGTLETMWLSRSRVHVLLIGQAASQMIMVTLGGILLLVVGALVFHARYWGLLPELLPVMLVLTVAMVGFAYLIAAAVLVLRDFNFVVDVSSYALLVFSGVMFPVAILPVGFQAIAFLLPTTFGLDILRTAALNSRPLMPPGYEWLGLVLTSALVLVVGRWVFGRAERRLRVRGELALH